MLSSSGGVQSNFGVAQGKGEVGPCSPYQMGTFLEHKRMHRRGRERFSLQVSGGYTLLAISYTGKTKENKQDKIKTK